jgi:hypothetical protein
MKPQLEGTKFGSITIDGQTYTHDVFIRLDGTVKKRKKKLSKAVYGTSHTISLAEAEYVFEQGAKKIILGSGQYGMVHLSEEAATFFESSNCDVEILPTPKAIEAWNGARGEVVGLFHTTC